MPGAHLKPAYILLYCLSLVRSLRSNAIVRLVPYLVAMHAVNAFNLNCLCSHSLSCQPCSLVVDLQACSHGLAEVHVAWTLSFSLKFRVSGQSKQTNKHRYTCVPNAVMLVWGLLRLAPVITIIIVHNIVI